MLHQKFEGLLEADSRINLMIKSPANGISSIQAGLEGSHTISTIFLMFTVALNADGINRYTISSSLIFLMAIN